MGEGVKLIEDAYNETHQRGYEGSMSACIHHMGYQPSVILTAGVDDIKSRIITDEQKVFRMSGMAGRMEGIETRTGAVDLWENGAKPRLIS